MLDNKTIEWIITHGINDGELYKNVTTHAIDEIVKLKIKNLYRERKHYRCFELITEMTIRELQKLAYQDSDIGEKLPFKISQESRIKISKAFLNYYTEEIDSKLNQ